MDFVILSFHAELYTGLQSELNLQENTKEKV